MTQLDEPQAERPAAETDVPVASDSLRSIDEIQDDVNRQLDELNQRIESIINLYMSSRKSVKVKEDQPSVAA